LSVWTGKHYLQWHIRQTTANIPRTGGQIKNDDSADDIKNVDLTQVHYLSGPFEIEGAAPGDLLLVEIMDVQPFDDQPWGFTGIFDRRNGVCSFAEYPLSLGTHADFNTRGGSWMRFIPRRT
jgi:hypothetical protein